MLNGTNHEIYCPLSYGNIGCRDLITKKVNEIFQDHFKSVNNSMIRTNYIEFINSMDIVFMYHNRSQAWGNIVVAIALGKPIFLKTKNSQWNYLNKMEIKCYERKKIMNLILKM